MRRVRLSMYVPRELAICFSEGRKHFLEKIIDLKDIEVYPTSMADQRHPDKIKINAWIKRALHRRVEKLKVLRKDKNITDTLISVLTLATDKITLTKEDYEQIAKDTENAANKKGSKPKKQKPKKD